MMDCILFVSLESRDHVTLNSVTCDYRADDVFVCYSNVKVAAMCTFSQTSLSSLGHEGSGWPLTISSFGTLIRP